METVGIILAEKIHRFIVVWRENFYLHSMEHRLEAWQLRNLRKQFRSRRWRYSWAEWKYCRPFSRVLSLGSRVVRWTSSRERGTKKTWLKYESSQRYWFPTEFCTLHKWILGAGKNFTDVSAINDAALSLLLLLLCAQCSQYPHEKKEIFFISSPSNPSDNRNVRR